MSNERARELSKKLIIEALRKYRGLFNKSPDDQALELYGEMLSESFEFKQITWALSQFVKKGSPFFPGCGEIFSLLTPPEEKKEDKAPLIVAEMIQAIRNYGQWDEERMLLSVSDDARAAFKALGPTHDVRNSENIETTKAQLERLVKGVLASKQNAAQKEQLEKIGISAKVISISKNKKPMQTVSYNDFIPKDLA